MRFPCDFDRGTPRRIAQTHKSEVELQCVDQHVDEPGGDGARFSAGPHSRDGRDTHEVLGSLFAAAARQPRNPSALGTIIALVGTAVAPGVRAETGRGKCQRGR